MTISKISQRFIGVYLIKGSKIHHEMSNSATKECFAEEIIVVSPERAGAVGGWMIEEGGVLAGSTSSPRVATQQSFEGFGFIPKAYAAAGIAVLSLFIFTSVLMVDSIHTIEEGSIGLYFVQGALDDRISHPGIHWAIPFITTVEEVTIRPKTDTLPSVRY